MRSGSLTEAVEALLGPGWAPVSVERHPVAYDVFLPGRTVVRVEGRARRGSDTAPFSLVEKRTAGPDLAPPVLRTSAAREAAAYESGLLDDPAPALRAPRLLGLRRGFDGEVVLRLEALRPEALTGDRILAAAGALGAMAGRWAGRAPRLPGLEPDWIARRAQPEAGPAGRARLLRTPGERARRGLLLLDGQPVLRRRLRALPQTLCHHDAVGANVFQDGSDTVLIDWETVGRGTVGVDLASLLLASVKRGDCSAGLVTELLDAAVAAYTAGVRSQTDDVPAEAVRQGFDAAAGLGWKVVADLASSIESGTPVRRGSAPDEDTATARAELEQAADLVLALGERAVS